MLSGRSECWDVSCQKNCFGKKFWHPSCCFCTVGDFSISGNSISFDSSSVASTQACLIFDPVDDDYIEDSEQFVFQARADDQLDQFGASSSGPFSLTIFDDDGIKNTFCFMSTIMISADWYMATNLSNERKILKSYFVTPWF